MGFVRMMIQANSNVLPGHQVLWRKGCVVWMGPIGAPIEDADIDKITVHPSDYEKISRSVAQKL
jgi:hypothetical protein